MLERSFANFRGGVASWSEEQLLDLLGPTWGPFANHSNLDLLLHAMREVVHHTAEIALLRDLYGSQQPTGN